ncbi:MAG: MFS transporter [Oscillochloris sp.]|nr:MFS transporter [Oscillochloris sp.]
MSGDIAGAVGIRGCAGLVCVVAVDRFAWGGRGAIDAGLNAYAAEQYSPRTITWLHACYGLGAASGPALMSFLLAADQPWQLGYAIVGGGQLVLALAFALTRRRWHAADADTAPEPRPAIGLRQTLGKPVVWIGCLVFLLYTGLEVSIGQWSFTLLTLGRGVPEVSAGQWVSGYWAALTVGRILAGIAANRLSPTVLLRLGLLGALLGSGLIWFDSAGGLLSLFGLLIAGLSLAPIFPALIATTPARVGSEHSANAVGFQVSAAMLGAAGLPWLIGQTIGSAGVPVIGPAIALSGMLYLGAYLMLELSSRR